MTAGEAAAIQALATAVTTAVDEFRSSMKREVEVSNEVHKDIRDILAAHSKDIGDLKIQMARLIGGLTLAGFVIGVFGVMIWQAVANK
jgi:hypothetical protein